MEIEKAFKILVVDDEKVILQFLEYNLSKSGFEVYTTHESLQAVDIAKKVQPDLILLDIMMPQQDGIETCRQLRSYSELKNTLIFFLTARAEEYSEVAAFDVGADDYIVKPIKPRALISRLNAVLRKKEENTPRNETIEIRDLIIDKSTYTVSRAGEEFSLPKKEFELLYFLAQNHIKVFDREELLNKIWGTDVFVVARTVDVHIRKVREKLGDDYIITVKGVGYRFAENPKA